MILLLVNSIISLQSLTSLDPLDSSAIQPIGSQRPLSAATPSHPDMPSFQRAPGAEVRSKSLGEEDSQVGSVF